MPPLEDDIAWHRLKAEETLAAIELIKAEPDSESRSAELQVLTEALGRYIMTAENLEAMRLPPPLKTLAWCMERRSALQAEADRLLDRPPQRVELERIVRLTQELREVEELIIQLNTINVDAQT